jgi:hypothetical protein
MTAEEHAAMEAEAHAIARSYGDLPYEVAVHLRRRDVSALVVEMIARVMGGTVKPQ